MSEKQSPLDQAQKLAQKTMKSMRDSIIEEAKKNEELFFKEIIQASQEARTKLPEEVFVKNFLPYFSGQKSIKENQEVIPMWIGIAGSATAPVDVVSPTGEVLYTVPAFYDTTVMNASARFEGPTLSATMVHYEMDKANLPQRANVRIQKELDQRMPSMFQKSSVVEENKKQWSTIFNRYGISTKQNTQQSQQSQSDIPVRDELDYD
jgi:hypothetical protein